MVDSIISIRNKGNKSKGITLMQQSSDNYLPDYYNGYRLSVKWLDQIRTHAQKGVFPYELFEKTAPNQTPKEAEYVRANYKQTTLQVFKDMVDTYGRAYHENNWSISYTPDADQYVNTDTTLARYLDSEFPEYGSLDNFIFMFLPPLKLMDAMGVVAVMPHELDTVEIDGEEVLNPDELVDPYTKFYHTTRVLAFDEGYAVIESEERSEVEYNIW